MQQTGARRPFSQTRVGEPVTIKAREQEKQGDVYKLRGDVEIDFRSYILRADEITYDSSTGDATATGNVRFDGGPHDTHIQGSRAEYNANRETGKFYDVTGTTGLRFKGRIVILTSSSPFAFTGKMVEKVNTNRFIVHHGTVTSCELPNPKWTFNAERVVVDVGGTAKIHNSTFRIERIPVFYFPWAQHPVEKLGRQSGFLTPVFTQSSRRGSTLGDSFFWAINPSMDATLGAEYYSQRGWAQQAEFRAQPTSTSYMDARFFGVVDRGAPAQGDQGGQDVRINGVALLPHGFRGVTGIEYLSSYVFRLAFNENFIQAVNSEVKSLAFVSRSSQGFSINGLVAHYQDFQSTTHGDVVSILHAPSFEFSSVDRRLADTRFVWSFEAAAEGVSRHEPTFSTADLVGRFDLHPRASLPLVLRGWTLRPEIALRDTYYTDRRQPDSGRGTPSGEPANRRAFEAWFELRPPALGRIFDRKLFGKTWKHTMEPRAIYHFVNGVDNFASIIRFDERDILSDTSDVEYGIVNRLYAKGTAPGANAREIVTWEVGQKYFLDREFGGALVTGRRNVFTTTADFTGIAFLTEPRRFSPVISRLRVQASANTDLQWNLDYDIKAVRINSSTALANFRWREWFLGGGHVFLQVPGEVLVTNPFPAQDKFNQFRVLLGYGHPNKRGLTAASNIGFDANLNFLQYSAFQTTYNWDCCGLNFEYRRFALGAVRNENQFRFAFTLANIGTFGNLRRQERLF